jgi:hypothetical protein
VPAVCANESNEGSLYELYDTLAAWRWLALHEGADRSHHAHWWCWRKLGFCCRLRRFIPTFGRPSGFKHAV